MARRRRSRISIGFGGEGRTALIASLLPSPQEQADRARLQATVDNQKIQAYNNDLITFDQLNAYFTERKGQATTDIERTQIQGILDNAQGSEKKRAESRQANAAKAAYEDLNSGAMTYDSAIEVIRAAREKITDPDMLLALDRMSRDAETVKTQREVNVALQEFQSGSKSYNDLFMQLNGLMASTTNAQVHEQLTKSLSDARLYANQRAMSTVSQAYQAGQISIDEYTAKLNALKSEPGQTNPDELAKIEAAIGMGKANEQAIVDSKTFTQWQQGTLSDEAALQYFRTRAANATTLQASENMGKYSGAVQSKIDAVNKAALGEKQWYEKALFSAQLDQAKVQEQQAFTIQRDQQNAQQALQRDYLQHQYSLEQQFQGQQLQAARDQAQQQFTLQRDALQAQYAQQLQAARSGGGGGSYAGRVSSGSSSGASSAVSAYNKQLMDQHEEWLKTDFKLILSQAGGDPLAVTSAYDLRAAQAAALREAGVVSQTWYDQEIKTLAPAAAAYIQQQRIDAFQSDMQRTANAYGITNPFQGADKVTGVPSAAKEITNDSPYLQITGQLTMAQTAKAFLDDKYIYDNKLRTSVNNFYNTEGLTISALFKDDTTKALAFSNQRENVIASVYAAFGLVGNDPGGQGGFMGIGTSPVREGTRTDIKWHDNSVGVDGVDMVGFPDLASFKRYLDQGGQDAVVMALRAANPGKPEEEIAKLATAFYTVTQDIAKFHIDPNGWDVAGTLANAQAVWANTFYPNSIAKGMLNIGDIDPVTNLVVLKSRNNENILTDQDALDQAHMSRVEAEWKLTHPSQIAEYTKVANFLDTVSRTPFTGPEDPNVPGDVRTAWTQFGTPTWNPGSRPAVNLLAGLVTTNPDGTPKAEVTILRDAILRAGGNLVDAVGSDFSVDKAWVEDWFNTVVQQDRGHIQAVEDFMTRNSEAVITTIFQDIPKSGIVNFLTAGLGSQAAAGARLIAANNPDAFDPQKVAGTFAGLAGGIIGAVEGAASGGTNLGSLVRQVADWFAGPGADGLSIFQQQQFEELNRKYNAPPSQWGAAPTDSQSADTGSWYQSPTWRDDPQTSAGFNSTFSPTSFQDNAPTDSHSPAALTPVRPDTDPYGWVPWNAAPLDTGWNTTDYTPSYYNAPASYAPPSPYTPSSDYAPYQPIDTGGSNYIDPGYAAWTPPPAPVWRDDPQPAWTPPAPPVWRDDPQPIAWTPPDNSMSTTPNDVAYTPPDWSTWAPAPDRPSGGGPF